MIIISNAQRLKQSLRFLGLICISNIALSMHGQVSVGSSEFPSKAAIVEIKSQNANTNNVTSQEGGLLLSRVILEDIKTLEPFIPNDANFKNNVNKVKDLHRGLMVYNLASTMSNATSSKRFLPGMYLWDGLQWQQMGDNKYSSKFFYPPAFNLPMRKVAADLTYDLYKEYERQFTKNLTNNPQFVDTQNKIGSTIPSSSDGKLYSRNELDYVVCYYDPKVLKIKKIDANGVMTYDVLDNNPSPESFLNLVFITKD